MFKPFVNKHTKMNRVNIEKRNCFIEENKNVTSLYLIKELMKVSMD